MSDDEFMMIDNVLSKIVTKKEPKKIKKIINVVKIVKKNSTKDDNNNIKINKLNLPDDDCYKTCHKCNNRKERTLFSLHKTTKDGYDNRCKECVKNVKIENKKKYENIDEKEIFDSLKEYMDTFTPNLNNKEWQGGKIKGTYFKRVGATKYTVNCDKMSKVVDTEKDAQELLIKYNQKNDLARNQYKIIEYNKQKYILMRLTKNYVTLFDFEDLDLLRKINVIVGKGSTNKNSKYYCVGTYKYTQKLIHNILTGYAMCDHINRYPLDNRRCNLQPTTHSDNNSNRTNISYKKIDIEDNKYHAKLKWVKNDGGFKSIYEDKIFDKLEEARDWLNQRATRVDNIKYSDKVTKELKSSYEEIMKKYAEDFKWCDNDDTKNDEDTETNSENDTDTEEIIKNKSKKKSEDNEDKVNLTKQEKYDLFKKIDKDFSLNKYSINIKCNTLQILKYNEIEYKFCGSCKLWVNYTEHVFKKYCKICTSNRNKNDINKREKTKIWKIKNKEKIAEYNKKYREEKLVKT